MRTVLLAVVAVCFVPTSAFARLDAPLEWKLQRWECIVLVQAGDEVGTNETRHVQNNVVAVLRGKKEDLPKFEWWLHKDHVKGQYYLMYYHKAPPGTSMWESYRVKKSGTGFTILEFYTDDDKGFYGTDAHYKDMALEKFKEIVKEVPFESDVAKTEYCKQGMVKPLPSPSRPAMGEQQRKEKAQHEGIMSCRVTRLATPPRIDADWEKSPWNAIRPESVRLHMGKRPEHFPKTEVKIAYDEAALYVIFRVEDRYVRAVTPKDQGPVCTDSCVEFFFSPGSDVSQGYFNVEMNCGGTTLFYFQRARGKDAVAIPETEFTKITRAHSLPRIVEPEITAPTTWTVEYRLPVEILKKYCPVTPPAPGVVWRANFYKCGDKTSHPHWLTWSPVDFPTPNFHLPEFFGTLRFE